MQTIIALFTLANIMQLILAISSNYSEAMVAKKNRNAWFWKNLHMVLWSIYAIVTGQFVLLVLSSIPKLIIGIFAHHSWKNEI